MKKKDEFCRLCGLHNLACQCKARASGSHQRRVGRRTGESTEKLCKMIREAVADRPDLNPNNKMRLTRTEMLDGKPVRCYIETSPSNAQSSGAA